MKVLVLLADGFEEVEALAPVDILRRAEIDVETLSIMDGREVKGAHGVPVIADAQLQGNEEADAIVLPGGLPGATNLAADPRVLEIVTRHYESGKIVSAICAAPLVLDTAGVLAEKNFTCYPGFQENIKFGHYQNEAVVIDGNVVTGRGPGYAMKFALALVEILVGKAKYDTVAKGFLLKDDWLTHE